jgi:hypothetical protein
VRERILRQRGYRIDRIVPSGCSMCTVGRAPEASSPRSEPRHEQIAVQERAVVARSGSAQEIILITLAAKVRRAMADC